MYNLIKNICVIVFVILFFAQQSSAQKFLIFPDIISNNTEIDSGNYIINKIITIKKGKILTIKKGVNLFFDKDAQIEVYGGFVCNGEKNNLITFTSLNPENPGKGIIVKGADNTPLNFNYCNFKYMSKPLHIQKNWLRSTINIKNSIFKFSELYGANIEINEVDNLLISKPTTITIENNTFSNNSGSILISEISSEFLQTSIKSNVICRNEYIGRDRNGMFTSPLFFNYNKTENSRLPIFKSNSIFDNFSNQFTDDSLSIDYTNLSVVGNADNFDVSDNYFGDPKNKEIENTFDFVSANYMAPILQFNQLDEIPDRTLNGHFYKILVNNNELDELINFTKLKSKISSVEFEFNRPVKSSDKYKILYYYLLKDTLISQELKHKLVWEENNKKLKIEINDNIFNKQKNGYIFIDGFYDENGMEVPSLFIGKKQFMKNNEIEMIISNFYENIPRKDLWKKRKKSTSNNIANNNINDSTNRFNDSINDILKNSKYWEAGVFFGNSLYWGDLYTTTVGLTYENFKLSYGLRLKYHINERFLVNFGANYMVISGTDDKNTVLGKERGTGFARGLSFRTTIFDINAMLEMDLLKYKSTKSYTPSIAVGANVYNFTPYGKYNDRWYKLRPIGTEGQTLKGGSGVYENWLFGIPISISVKKHMGIRNVISLSYTYNKIFTDYLDDVSTGIYPNADELKKANPSLGDIAVKLSNPNDQKGQRSASADFDGYGYWGITWTHKFLKK
ncbi:MAG: hypothetical protein IT243_06610 [Bacteroidia bacterium]|nr:hypothetical protein [Bacteroidia bacterium]